MLYKKNIESCAIVCIILTAQGLLLKLRSSCLPLSVRMYIFNAMLHIQLDRRCGSTNSISLE